MKIKLIFALFIFITIPSQVFSEIKKGEWEFIKDTEYCFVQSAPIKTEIPEGKSRGENYILVYRMHKSPDLIIQITAGYNYKSSDSVNVKIDNFEYDFYSDEDNAWAKDDKKIIYAMKKGLDFVTTGISSKGTKVIDTYSLKGFTSAVNKLSNDC